MSFLEYVLVAVVVLIIISQLGLIENASLLYFYSKWCRITIYPGPTVVHLHHRTEEVIDIRCT